MIWQPRKRMLAILVLMLTFVVSGVALARQGHGSVIRSKIEQHQSHGKIRFSGRMVFTAQRNKSQDYHCHRYNNKRYCHAHKNGNSFHKHGGLEFWKQFTGE